MCGRPAGRRLPEVYLYTHPLNQYNKKSTLKWVDSPRIRGLGTKIAHDHLALDHIIFNFRRTDWIYNSEYLWSCRAQRSIDFVSVQCFPISQKSLVLGHMTYSPLHPLRSLSATPRVIFWSWLKGLWIMARFKFYLGYNNCMLFLQKKTWMKH